ncbi:MAG: FeoB-associated Cys-rich membrane protein [bacterium]|nr:FeoB-associated Cys-rich membrane protein [bacterium]
MGFQEIIALLIVAACAAYVVRSFIGSASKKDCCNCGKNKKNVVTIEMTKH